MRKRTPGGKRIKESLGAEDRKQAQELHDRRKAELWRIDRLGDFPDVTFEEACLRWLEEKAHKKSLDADKGRIGFWLMHFEGVLLKDISEAKIYAAVRRMTNRKAKERWEQRAVSMAKKGLDIGEYKPAAVSQLYQSKAPGINESANACSGTGVEMGRKVAGHQSAAAKK